MDLGLNGKTALVTASSKGLGLATARLLAAEDANVVLCGRDQDALATAAWEITASGGKCVALVADLDDAPARAQLVRQAIEHFGAIDVAVLNTAGPATGNFRDLGLEEWDAAYDRVIRPVVDLIHQIIPGMIDRGWGRLLTVTSFAVKNPLDMLALSGSLRGSLTGLMRVLANELGPHGVTANSILPGYTMTDRMRTVLGQQAQSSGVSLADASSAVEGRIPVRRLGTPEEFAATAAFLVSGPAGFINGQAIVVDGGFIPTIL